MAGKLLSLEDAAQRLGVSVEEVQRLVDRKQLYPVRDGATLKFKQDDIDRHAAEEGALSGGSSGLSLDLDAEPLAPGAADALEIEGVEDGPELAGGAADLAELDLGDSLPADAGKSGGVTGSGGPAAAGGSASGGLSLAEELNLDDGLVIEESAVPESMPSLVKQPVDVKKNTGTLPIDLSGLGADVGGSESNATGSIVGGSGQGSLELSGRGSNVGSALSGVLDEGVSLEDSDVRKSGILSGSSFDDDMVSAIKASGAASGLAGEEMDVFEPVEDGQEAGSEIVADESGTLGSSFLEENESSSSVGLGEDESAFGGALADDLKYTSGGAALLPDTSFSVWQVCGLICCALLMLTGGFVMYDLIRTLGTPEDPSWSSPLVNPLSELFGWRR